MAQSIKSAKHLIQTRIADAARGDMAACYDLGIVFSSGSEGMAVDLVAAHKWFNLAAIAGDEASQMCRAEIAGEMDARQIAEAQRQARAWLQLGRASA